MSVRLFSKTLTASFVASSPVLITADTLVLEFELTIGTLASVEWYLEFSDDPFATTPKWFREVAQDDKGSGNIEMPIVVRKFLAFGGAALSAGSYALDSEFIRRRAFARIQIRAASGAGSAVVTAPLGTAPVAPA